MLNQNIKLSIIIPVYNTERYIEKALDSLFNQTCQEIEVIVVNNGSSGNIEEIVRLYQSKHKDRFLKLVTSKVNLGTFHGRGLGMSVAEGEYFTFMDADDRVGIDFYHQLIVKGDKTKADIVMADLLHEDDEGRQFRYIEDPAREDKEDVEGVEKVFDYYYGYSGLSYSIYGIWNKIYRRTLWDRCKPFIDAITEQFALCEDAAYTTIFFSQAKKITHVHNQYYYHYVHSDSASGNLVGSVEKVKRNAAYQGTAFRNIIQHLIRAGLYEKYSDNFKQFRNLHLRIMLFEINRSIFNN